MAERGLFVADAPQRERSGAGPEDVGRDLAIPAIGMAPWGTHFCQFYDTKQDLLDTLVPFFRAGLENNEKCVWITSEPLDTDDATEALSRQVDDLERRIAAGQMWFLPHESWYGDSGGDQSERYLQAIAPGIELALQEGYAGLRGTGNASWVQPSCWKPYMDYEEGIGLRYGDQPLIALCTFPLAMCDSVKMIDVLMRHRYGLIRQADWTLIEPSQDKRATAAVEQMNVALAERTTQLQAALADLRGFSRWITHDLRVPLASVTSFGDLLAQEWAERLDDRGREALEGLRRGASRMDQLIAGTLAYSTVQNATPNIVPLDLRAIVGQVWPTVAGAARPASLQVGDLPMAHGDRRLLTQALEALLGNAAKYTAGRSDALVQVGATVADGETVYHVRDNGIGFDMADADAIFGAFTRLHAVTESEGTGLGLTVAKEIITRHGGRIWAEGEVGAGAAFYFTLPAPVGLPAIGTASRS